MTSNALPRDDEVAPTSDPGRNQLMSDDTITLTKSTTPRQGAAEVTVPRSLGPVRLIRQIGRGGMGVVYLGRHEMLSRDVAVKFLLNAVAGPGDQGFERFLEGARAAAAVRHDGLTTIHHADIIDGVPYLVMEYVDGPTLSDVLKRHGALSPSATLAVLDEVLASVSALHEQGIIHRDIKPSNILLDRGGRVLVTDFGLASSKAQVERGDASAGPAGTPAYMAPELYDGEVSLRSDVYALGITAFELLTGSRPFGGATLAHTRRQHAESALPVESLHQHDIDGPLIEILERATHKNAVLRYKSAAHLRSAFRSAGSTPEVRASGSAEMQKLILTESDDSGRETIPAAQGKTPSSSYFDRLRELAVVKRATPGRLQAKGGAAADAVADDEPPPCINIDLACIRCGYNLRGLTGDGRCPECGTPVERSQRGDLLAAADSHWLASVCRGVTLICVSATTVTLSFLATLLVLTILVGTGGAANVVFTIGSTVVFLSTIGLLLGVIAVTRPDPRLSLGEEPIVLRRIARAATIAALVFITAGHGLRYAGGPEWIHITATWGKVLTFLVGVIAAVYYMAYLGDRIPEPQLTRKTRSAALAFSVLTAIMLFSRALPAILKGMNVSPAVLQDGFAIAIGLTSLAFFLYGTRLLGLMSRYRRVLRPCLTEALERDRAAAAGPISPASGPPQVEEG